MKKILPFFIGFSAVLLIGCSSSNQLTEVRKINGEYKIVPLKKRVMEVRPSPNFKELSVIRLCTLLKHENQSLIYSMENPSPFLRPPQEEIDRVKHEVVDARAELKRRNAFTKSERYLIKNRKVRVGMSKTALICSWGRPDRINRSSYGDAQYVYGGQYVYVSEQTNRVTAWN